MEEDEYELVPLSPLRKVEKRLQNLEKGGTNSEMIKELVTVVKTNQQVVDDIIKINSDVINKISDLSASVNNMTNKLNDFMERLEIVEEHPIEKGELQEEEKSGEDVAARLDERLSKMEKRINALIISSMAKTRLSQKPKGVFK